MDDAVPYSQASGDFRGSEVVVRRPAASNGRYRNDGIRKALFRKPTKNYRRIESTRIHDADRSFQRSMAYERMHRIVKNAEVPVKSVFGRRIFWTKNRKRWKTSRQYPRPIRRSDDDFRICGKPRHTLYERRSGGRKICNEECVCGRMVEKHRNFQFSQNGNQSRKRSGNNYRIPVIPYERRI